MLLVAATLWRDRKDAGRKSYELLVAPNSPSQDPQTSDPPGPSERPERQDGHWSRGRIAAAFRALAAASASAADRSIRTATSNPCGSPSTSKHTRGLCPSGPSGASARAYSPWK